MGLYATSVKRYAVEYGETHGFKNDSDTLFNIISNYCENCYFGDDGSGCPCVSAIWEIDKDEFRGMINALNNLTDEEFNTLLKSEWCNLDSKVEVYTKDVVISFLQGFLNETQEDSDYVRIAWV